MVVSSKEIVREIVIPDYPSQIVISKARRPVYYVNTLSVARGKKFIPKMYLSNKKKYGFDKEGILINKVTEQPVLANPRTAGKPRYWQVNFQQIWNGAVNGPARAAKASKLKEIFGPYVQRMEPIESTMYPLGLELVIFDTEFPVDVSNKAVIYIKIIEDLLVTYGIIHDDSPDIVNDSGRLKYVKIDKKEDRKMLIRIFRSDNLPL